MLLSIHLIVLFERGCYRGAHVSCAWFFHSNDWTYGFCRKYARNGLSFLLSNRIFCCTWLFEIHRENVHPVILGLHDY